MARVIAERVMRELRFESDEGIESLALRPVMDDHVVDAIEAAAVHVMESALQADPAPRRAAAFVGIVEHEPIGINRRSERLHSAQDFPPLVRGGRAARRKPFHADHARAEQLLRPLACTVRGPVVQNVHVDPLSDEVPERLSDDVGFVEGRHERDDAKVLRLWTKTRRSIVLENGDERPLIGPSRKRHREPALGKKSLQVERRCDARARGHDQQSRGHIVERAMQF
jgi:hypothetical protein